MASEQPIEVFFDGACPICSREIAMIRTLDRNHRIGCTDITGQTFDAKARGLDPNTINQQIHARLSEGRVISGVEVFRQIYDSLGFRRWVQWSRRPWIARVLEYAYALFARYRRPLARPLHWMKR